MTDAAARAELLALLDDAAGDLSGVERRATGEGVEYRRAGAPFAVVTGTGAEFRLAPEVARAATGTPATRRSPRGEEWVVFEPGALERFDRDRATAWFTSAWRMSQRKGRRG